MRQIPIQTKYNINSVERWSTQTNHNHYLTKRHKTHSQTELTQTHYKHGGRSGLTASASISSLLLTLVHTEVQLGRGPVELLVLANTFGQQLELKSRNSMSRAQVPVHYMMV